MPALNLTRTIVRDLNWPHFALSNFPSDLDADIYLYFQPQNCVYMMSPAFNCTLSKDVLSHNPFLQSVLNVKLRAWPWPDPQRASVKSMNDCFSFPLSNSSQNLPNVSIYVLKEISEGVLECQ